MIIRLPRKPFYGETYLVCLTAPVDLATFLRRAEVTPQSYAEELMTELHEQIFVRSLELKRDYSGYYTCEYPTFQDYLRKHVRFPPAAALEASDQSAAYGLMLQFHSSYCFLEEDSGIELLRTLLEPKAIT